MLPAKAFIKSYVEAEKLVVKDGFTEAMEKIEADRGVSYDYSEEEVVIVAKIKELIETYVKPAVEEC